MLNIEYLYGPAIYKEVLRLRGVIAGSAVRDPGAARLDARDRDELDAILGRMQDMFVTKPPITKAGSAEVAIPMQDQRPPSHGRRERLEELGLIGLEPTMA